MAYGTGAALIDFCSASYMTEYGEQDQLRGTSAGNTAIVCFWQIKLNYNLQSCLSSPMFLTDHANCFLLGCFLIKECSTFLT